MKVKPAVKAYQELQEAYDFFNKRLFDSELPDLLITLQRGKNTFGYFSPDRFTGESKIAELAMNPNYFGARSLADTLSTLVHEMVHVWQWYTPAKQCRMGYHDRVWGVKMEEIGLMPSNTGRAGGKKTGQQMTHYIMPNGAFQKTVFELLKNGYSISWYDVYGSQNVIDSRIDSTILSNWLAEADDDDELIEKLTLTVSKANPPEEDPDHQTYTVTPPPIGASTRSKYNCLSCGLNAWAKPSANLICGDCNEAMEAV